ncbi:MAG: DUF1294 domain-containing protein [Anaerolineae bacterium]|nr:DUF1294 domain-containing protein [Anaerolineae bacterium]
MKNSAPFFTAMALFFAIVSYVLLYLYTHWSFYVMWLVAWGAATFFLYTVDKTQAILGNWRIPEQVLHLFALVGGVFGGWLGMFVLWHKVRKPAFWVILLVSTVIQVVVSQWF